MGQPNLDPATNAGAYVSPADWNALIADGGQEIACGWCRDRWGVSWQITPRLWEQFHNSANAAGAQRAMKALMGMKKLDIAQLQAAFDGAA